jgi:hypothetical protein
MFEMKATKGAFGARFKRGRDASTFVPEVREVVAVAEDVDPDLGRQRGAEGLSRGF